jgi:large subunit ribosomal protein L23
MYGLIKHPVFTKKTTSLLEKYNQYVFEVDRRLTKTQIQQLIEERFSVQVKSVNTHNIPNRKRRLKSHIIGNSKHAIVTLKRIEKIVLFP